MTTNDWRDQAACAQIGDTDLFYPEKGGSTRPAKSVCAACPVRRQCLEAALATPTTDDWGTWGGTSERERRELRRSRKNEAA